MADTEVELKEKQAVEVQVPDDLKPGDTLTVDLDKKETETQSQAQKGEKYVSLDELQKIQKQVHTSSQYATRNVDSLRREISELKQLLTQPPQKLPTNGAGDELDQLLEKDWKAAVRKLAGEEAETRYQRAVSELQRQQEAQQRVSVLEQSKEFVRKRHPEIDDGTSEKAKLYMEVLNEDPGILQEQRGPEIAMYRMEERLKGMGKFDEKTIELAEKEAERRLRTGATRVPTSSATNKDSRKIVLDKAAREYCDRLGIKYEEYAKHKHILEQPESQGVEI